MRYAFVCLTILVIWVAVILMALAIRKDATPALYYAAIFMTVGLFGIGFRSR